MTDPLIPAPAAPEPNPSPASCPRRPRRRRPRLLTRDQVLAALRQEVLAAGNGGPGGLTATAKKYGVSVSQLSDVLRGSAKLSERLYTKLNYILHEFFEKREDRSERAAGEKAKEAK